MHNEESASNGLLNFNIKIYRHRTDADFLESASNGYPCDADSSSKNILSGETKCYYARYLDTYTVFLPKLNDIDVVNLCQKAHSHPCIKHIYANCRWKISTNVCVCTCKTVEAIRPM